MSINTHSRILKKILSDDKNIFSSLLNIKIDELKNILNNHIKNSISENLNKFYDTPNQISENELFDDFTETEIEIIKCKAKIYSIYGISKDEFNSLKNEKCFKINLSKSRNNTYQLIFCKKYIIFSNWWGDLSNKQVTIHYIEHNIPIHILNILKIIFFGFTSGTSFSSREILNILNKLSEISLKNNKIFYPNALEFENICEEEYNNINTIKQELEDNNIEFNDKNNKMNKEKELFEKEKEQLDKDKKLFEKEKEQFNQMKKQFNYSTFYK
jgi:hypothetical protein